MYNCTKLAKFTAGSIRNTAWNIGNPLPNLSQRNKLILGFPLTWKWKVRKSYEISLEVRENTGYLIAYVKSKY